MLLHVLDSYVPTSCMQKNNFTANTEHPSTVHVLYYIQYYIEYAQDVIEILLSFMVLERIHSNFFFFFLWLCTVGIF